MRSQSKGIGSADIDASMCHKIRTIPALLHCASHWQDNAALHLPLEAGVGRIRARCLAVRLPNPPVRTVLAAFTAHGSREREILQ